MEMLRIKFSELQTSRVFSSSVSKFTYLAVGMKTGAKDQYLFQCSILELDCDTGQAMTLRPSISSEMHRLSVSSDRFFLSIQPTEAEGEKIVIQLVEFHVAIFKLRNNDIGSSSSYQ